MGAWMHGIERGITSGNYLLQMFNQQSTPSFSIAVYTRRKTAGFGRQPRQAFAPPSGSAGEDVEASHVLVPRECQEL